MRKNKNNKGFTLVELLVVMAIMAILVGAVAPQVAKYVEKAREAKDIQLLGTVFTAANAAIASGELSDQKGEFTSVTSATRIKEFLPPDMQSSEAIIQKCKSSKGKTEGNQVYVFYDKTTGYLGVYIAKDAVELNEGDDTAAEYETTIKAQAAIGPVSNQ